MENKYFVPDIEDIRVGYECQIYNKTRDEWNTLVVTDYLGRDSDGEIPECFEALTNRSWEKEEPKDKIRVPYLTEEQIEAEGWKLTKSIIGNSVPIFEKGNYWAIFYEEERFLKIIPIDPAKVENIDKMAAWILYQGFCKDINTFRYICKLLKINGEDNKRNTD